MGFTGVPPPAGFEEVDEQEPDLQASAVGVPPPPPGFEEVPEEGEGKPLFAGRKVGEEPETSGGNVLATAARFYGLPGHTPGRGLMPSGPVPAAAAPAPAPQLPTPLPQGQVSRYSPPRPKGPSWEPSIATPVPQMESTELPSEPLISNVEAVRMHAPGPVGPKLTEEAKAALRATPKDVSAFQGVPAGQPVTTRPGGPQSLAEAAGRVMGPDWQRTAEEIYGKTGAKVLKGTGTAVASFEDSMGSATNLGLIGGLGAVTKIATAKWGPEVGKNVSRLVDAKFAADIGGALATDRMNELGEAIESQDPEKMANAAVGAILDFTLLAHPAKKPAERGGGVTLGGIIPNMVEGVTPAGQGRIALEQQGARRAAERARAQERFAAAAGQAGRGEAMRQAFEAPPETAPKLPPPPPGFEEVPEEPQPAPPLEQVADQLAEGMAENLRQRTAQPEPPPSVQVERVKQATPDLHEIHERSARHVEENGPDLVAQYRQRFGKIVSADEAKELLPEFGRDFNVDPEDRIRRSSAVQEPSSALSKAVYAQMLSEPAPEGQTNLVLFTAGGPGSGKSTAVDAVPEIKAIQDQAQIVYDSTLSNPKSAKAKIDQALAAGKRVVIAFVDRDPRDAFQGVIGRSRGPSARMVPVDYHADAHVGVREIIPKLMKEHADNPDVEFRAIDNTGAPGTQKVVDPGAIKGLQYEREELRSGLADAAHAAYQDGRLTPAGYEAALPDAGERHDVEGVRGRTGERHGDESAEENAERGAQRPPPEPAPDEVARRADELKAQFEAEGQARRGPLKERAAMRTRPPGGEEFRQAAKEQIADEKAVEPQREPGERAENAETVARPQDQEHGEAADTGGRLPEPEPAVEGAGRAEPAPGGRGERGGEAPAELKDYAADPVARGFQVLDGVKSRLRTVRVKALRDAGYSVAKANSIAKLYQTRPTEKAPEPESKPEQAPTEGKAAAPAIGVGSPVRWTKKGQAEPTTGTVFRLYDGTGGVKMALVKTAERSLPWHVPLDRLEREAAQEQAPEGRSEFDRGQGLGGLPSVAEIFTPRRVAEEARKSTTRLGTEEPIGKVPTVDWAGRDTDGPAKVNAETIRETYVQLSPLRDLGVEPVVYKSYIDRKTVEPLIQLFEEVGPNGEKLETPDYEYDWSGFGADDLPPIKMSVGPDGKPAIIDGNHRAKFWLKSGADQVPAWVLDFRKDAGAYTEEEGHATEQPPERLGDRGETSVEGGRPEDVRRAEEERAPGEGPPLGAGAREERLRGPGEAGYGPGRGADRGAEDHAQVRPGERPGEAAALGEGGGRGEREGGDRETRGERPPSSEDQGREDVRLLGEDDKESHVEATSRNAGADFRFASPAEAEADLSLGPRARVSANLEAVQLLKAVQAEGRPATAEEQAILAKYSGWGSFPGLFRYGSDLYDKGEELKRLVGADAYAEAQRSVLNAHFTAPRVVGAMWDMARRLGFKGGRLLEPALGSGNFFALMPPEIRGRSKLTGVELDDTTGNIGKLLYPNANVQVKGFQDLEVPDGFFDFAISNVPFGDYRVNDKNYNKFKANIHDYFFLKSLDKVRPGGAVAFITSTGTLDKFDSGVRQAMIEKGADLVAAVRLPGKTFAKSAGTDVVTDIVILRKRLPGEQPAGPAWTKVVEVPDPAGRKPIPVNEYFKDHPEQILGRLDRSGTMYREESVNVARTEDFEKRFEDAIARLPEKVIKPRQTPKAFEPATIAAENNSAKVGGFAVQDGKLYVRTGEMMTEQKAAPEVVKRIGAMLGVRDAVRDVFNTQLSGAGREAIDTARGALNRTYDAFVKQHGPVSEPANAKAIADDPDAPLLLALERRDKKTGAVKKTDVFTKDTIRPYIKAESADSPSAALAISLKEHGGVNLERMAELLKTTEADLGKDLVRQGLAYDDPKLGWAAGEQYLSGNVRRKLAEAQAASAADDRYKPNVEALKKVQPEDVDYLDIDARVGSPWVPPTDMVGFMQHLIGGNEDDFIAHHTSSDGSWLLSYSNSGKRRHEGREADSKLWGTDRAGFMDVLNSAAAGKPIVVRDPVPPDKTEVNHEATAAANQKVEDLKAAFKDWVWDDAERRQRLHRYYNDNFNNIRPVDYSAEHYKDAEGNYVLPGMNPAKPLRKVQADFVWRVVTTGRGLAAHEVGVGKTAAMVSAAMELRRLGLAHKPIIAVPNAVINGFLKKAQTQYPAARILATGQSFDAKNRRETIARIATGDWDMVLMTHDNLNMLPMRPEVVERFIGDEIRDLEAAIDDVSGREAKGWGRGAKSSDNRIVKELEKKKLKLEARLKEAIEGGQKDKVANFEELGGDALFVDEAHLYKSLPVYTSRQNLKGLPTTRSDRATNMAMRTRWLLEQNDGRGVVFATGTPIANTMVELYNMQRYLQPREMQERGVQAFDSWLNTFGDTTTKMEVTATGDFKPVTRLARFTNVPELQQIARDVIDVRHADEVTGLVRPKRHDELVTVPMSDNQRRYLSVIQARAEELKKARGRPEKGSDNMLALSTDARKSAMDFRLIDPTAPDDPGSKVNAAIKKVLEIHKEQRGATQLIFSDFGVHEQKGGAPSIYRDITRKLVKGGIPRDRIVDFSDLSAKDKDTAIGRLKNGEALVGIGSTEKLGTGVNVQDKLYAVHHLDVPWLPASIEQRDGRIWRQGNEHKDIKIFRYSTEGSFDTFMWQAVDNKSRFIKQFMEGGYSGRDFKDADGEELTHAQIMAITSGEPKLLEKVQLEDDVRNLERAAKRHEKTQGELKDSIPATEAEIRIREARIKGYEDTMRAAVAAHDEAGGEFSAIVDGKTYTKRKDAGDALRVPLRRGLESYGEGQTIGQYRGFPIEADRSGVTLVTAGDPLKVNVNLDAPESLFQSADNTLRSLPGRIKAEEAYVETAKDNIEKTKAQIGLPYKGEADLQGKRARLAEVQKELTASLEAKRQAAQTPEAKAETEETAARIKAAAAPEGEGAPAEEAPDRNAFYIRKQEGDWAKVKATSLKIPGVENEFFVHKDPDGGYVVSEARTGLRIASGEKRLDTVTHAKSVIDQNSAKLAGIVRDTEAKQGLSPRYAAAGEKGEAAFEAPPRAAEQDFRALRTAARPKEAEPEPVAPGAPPPRTPLRELKPTILAPVFDPKVAKRLGQVTMRATLADMARRHDIEATAMTEWDKHFDTPRRMETPAHIEEIAQEWEGKGKKAEAKALRDHAEQIDFIDRVERGGKQESPEKQKLADYLERAWDARKEELIALGKEAARSWNLDYFPHIWEDPTGIRDRIRAILGRRPLEGQKGFEKHRSFPTTMDGLRAGYVPVDWNPIRLSLLKMSEMDRAITARRFLQDLDRLGMKKYVRHGQQIAGWRVPKDNAFQVWKSGDVEVKEAFDKKLMEQLESFADSLGVKVSTKRALGKGRWGVSREGEIGRRFGGPEFVVTHELGHHLDKRFGLYEKLSKIEGVDHELQELSNYRIGEDTDATMGEIGDFQKYARTPDEMTANLVHAFIHTPELARRVAPKAIKALRELAMKERDLRPLLSIKPSLELGEASTTYSAGGPVKTGGWAVPEPIADLLDTHLSPSLLSGSKAFRAYRKTSQALLMARLGWSAFHLGFTTSDATLSRIALAGTYASRGNVGEALKSLANIPKVTTGWFRDNPIIKEWYRPGTQGEEIGAIVKALEMGGARGRQGDLYNLGSWESFFRDLRREGTLKATLGHPVRNAAALVEAGSRYVLNTIVPRQKMAIAAEMARRELLGFQEETGAKDFAEALRLTNPERVKDIMGRVWDSVDNRMGQVVYDNLFLNRTLRDALHATIQSVGWNLGTWRELGGGIHDIKYLVKPDVDVTGKALPRVSDRLAYTLALPFFHALLSTAIQYAYTGERPKDMTDLMFPRSGRMNPDGSPARLSPATYMKDVWAYLSGFSRGAWHGVGQVAQTLSHKTNPMLSMMTDLARNEDFYGTEIIDKNAPVAQQLMDLARFLGKSGQPYSVQGFLKEQKSGASKLEALPAFFGLPPASAAVSRTPAEQALVEYQRAHMPREPRSKAQAEYSDLRKTLVHAQRSGDSERFAEAAKEAQEKGIMSKREILKLGRSTASTALENKFKALPLEEAARVYAMGTPDQKASWGPLLKRKIASRGGLAHVPLADRVKIVKKAQEALQGAR